MGKIHVLETEVSNKIAAGEVVERPASVVKELVENSIDAGASLITVEIKKGGSMYIRVSDNGSGMSADDAKICFLRHATSKIQTSADLEAIYTLGFRGEALSSIGAVAKVELYTKREEDSVGICVHCDGGEIVSSEEAGIPDGTSITVNTLFYNTPARLKFLKKDATEAGYIKDIMTRFMFAHPEISFKLISDGKEKLFSPGDSSVKNAVYTAYGKDYANGILTVDYENGGVHVMGVVGKGTLGRPKRNYQSFFVNQRYVMSRTVTAALENAYKNQIMIGKFPMAVLNIVIDPALIDINVHPTKMEVKFSDEKAIYNAVYYGVMNALYAAPNVPKIERETGDTKAQKGRKIFNLDRDTKIEKGKQLGFNEGTIKTPKTENNPPIVNKADLDFILPKKPKEDRFDFTIHTKVASPKREMPSFAASKINDAPIAPSVPQEETVKEEIKTAPPLIEDDNQAGEETVFADEYFKIVGQVFDTYIIAEKGEEMMIIDQHAAHERLNYERLKEDMENKNAMSQILIEPVIVNVTASEMQAYRDNIELITGAGFESEEFGDDAIIIRAVPGEVEMGEVEDLMLELLSQGEELKKELITDRYQTLLYTIACKSAVKANMRMGAQEMEALVKKVLRLKNINTCPHGRPIIITMSKKEMEKEFKRIV